MNCLHGCKRSLYECMVAPCEGRSKIGCLHANLCDHPGCPDSWSWRGDGGWRFCEAHARPHMLKDAAE